MKVRGRKKANELAIAKEQGRQLLLERKEKEALQFLEEGVERFPTDPEIRLLYANILLVFRPEDVATEAAKAVALGPDDPKILIGAGQRLLFGGDIEAARSCATRANDLVDPDFRLMPSLFNLNGLLAAFAGEDDLAEECLRAAVEREPDNESWVKHLAVFLAERGRLEEAVAVLDEALKHVEHNDDLEQMRTRMTKEAAEQQ